MGRGPLHRLQTLLWIDLFSFSFQVQLSKVLKEVSLYGESGYSSRSSDLLLRYEVDKVKIEVIEKLSSPIFVKGVRSFLGHASFYLRFSSGFWDFYLSWKICVFMNWSSFLD